MCKLVSGPQMSHTSGGRVLMPASSFGFVQLSHLWQLPEMAEVDHRHRLRSPCPPTKPSQLVTEAFFPPIKTTDHPPGGCLFHVTIMQITKIIRWRKKPLKILILPSLPLVASRDRVGSVFWCCISRSLPGWSQTHSLRGWPLVGGGVQERPGSAAPGFSCPSAAGPPAAATHCHLPASATLPRKCIPHLSARASGCGPTLAASLCPCSVLSCG